MINSMAFGAKETQVRESIIWYIKVIWWYVVRTQSWKITIPNKNWSYRAVRLADAWTPDVIACINWRFVWIEVKRDEAEKRKWHREQQKRSEWLKFDVRSVNQKESADKIKEAWWLFCLAASASDLHDHLIEWWLISKDRHVPWL